MKGDRKNSKEQKPFMVAKVQAVVNAELYDAAKKSESVKVVGGKTVEYANVTLPNKADDNGIFSAEVKAEVLSNFHYARLVGKEMRGGEETDNPYAKVFCLPDGNKLRPFFHNGDRQIAMFTTKCLMAIYANSKGWLNVALEWVGEDRKSVHHKPLLCGGGKLCGAFFTGGVGEKLQKAIAAFLKENILDLEVPAGLEFNFNPENLAPAVIHCLFKANGYRYGIFADLSQNGRYKTVKPVTAPSNNGNGHNAETKPALQAVETANAVEVEAKKATSVKKTEALAA